jgi:hypothetical protein
MHNQVYALLTAHTLPKLALWVAAKPIHYGVYDFSPGAL